MNPELLKEAAKVVRALGRKIDAPSTTVEDIKAIIVTMDIVQEALESIVNLEEFKTALVNKEKP